MYVYWRGSSEWDNTYNSYDSHNHSYHKTHDRTRVARPIAFAHVHLRDPIALSYNTHFLCTTVAYRRMIYRTIKCIAHRANFIRILFHIRVFLATVYDQNLHFSVARIFCYFGSCANCEDPIFLLLKLYFHSKYICSLIKADKKVCFANI